MRRFLLTAQSAQFDSFAILTRFAYTNWTNVQFLKVELMSIAARLSQTAIAPGFVEAASWQHFPADEFPLVNPVHWLTSHFAVGGWSPLQRLSGMLTAHMTQIAPRNGFSWHPHRGLEIYTWVLEGELYHEDTTGGKGIIRAGELQRMFAGEYIEHQELNVGDVPARVIQIWYIADPRYRDLPPHYQQTGQAELPVKQSGAAQVFALIGDGSPMEQHIPGRLTASFVNGGSTVLENPRAGEDLFLYVTDGSGAIRVDGEIIPAGQYDVLLVRPDAPEITIDSASGLNYLSFYLPPFLEQGYRGA
jgi:redox-sensitive bicupin YhaK (pirin superfamily)